MAIDDTRRRGRELRRLGILLLAGGLSAAVGAQSAVPAKPDASVTVHATQLRYAGRALDDLDALAATMLPRAPQTVALRAWGVGATHELLATAERFGQLQLELAVSDEGDVRCEPGRVLVAAAAGATLPVLRGVNDERVARWWAVQMP
jgi:hypothetical protein